MIDQYEASLVTPENDYGKARGRVSNDSAFQSECPHIVVGASVSKS